MKSTPLYPKHSIELLALRWQNLPVITCLFPIQELSMNTMLYATGLVFWCKSHMGEFIVKGRQASIWYRPSAPNASQAQSRRCTIRLFTPNRWCCGWYASLSFVWRHVCRRIAGFWCLWSMPVMEDKDWDWISSLNTFDTWLIQHLDETGLIAVQGPKP